MSNFKHGHYAIGADPGFKLDHDRKYHRKHPKWKKAYNHAYQHNLPTPRVRDFV